MQLNILNYYEKRIPKILRKLTKSYLKRYNYKCIKYDENFSKQLNLIKWADILFLTPGRFLSDELISNAKHIKLIQIWSSGFDKLNLKAIKKFKIPLANNYSVNSTSVAEHTIMLMLNTLRKFPIYSEITHDCKWAGNSHGTDCFNLKNKKIGIIGLGKVGKKVAKICKSFGCQIYYNDLKIKKNSGYKYLSLREVFKNCDIITLHLHFNSKTKHIVNKKILNLMHKNSFLINVSRAELVDNKYLNHLLNKKKIAGVGIDVFENEPTQKGDYFIKSKNACLTPHTAGSTIDTYKEVLETCVQNFERKKKKKKIKLVKI